MKKLFIILLIGFVSSCNQDVALDVDPRVTLTPDYNLLSEGPTYLEYDARSNQYRASPVIYLRPFENVTSLDNVTLQFTSNYFGSYIVASDTLYNGDKINVRYGDFKRYLLAFTYLSEIKGRHSIIVSTTIRSVAKSTTVTCQTR